MKSYTEYIWMNTENRHEIVNITSQVGNTLRKSGVKEGLCLVIQCNQHNILHFQSFRF